VIAEWKGRVDRLEEEWTSRLASCEEKAAIAIATSKGDLVGDEEFKEKDEMGKNSAEMHATLNTKDQEIEKWMNKCHTLEKRGGLIDLVFVGMDKVIFSTDSDANKRMQGEIDELNKLVVAMESEKADMVEKLARAKQEGVKVRLKSFLNNCLSFVASQRRRREET
jgi:hypothetical protein